MSREAIAKLEVGHTDISPLLSKILAMIFVLTITSVPLIEYINELVPVMQSGRTPVFPRMVEAIRIPLEGLRSFRSTTGSPVPRVFAANREALRSIHAFEENLEQHSVVGAWFRPRVQAFLTGALGAGNEQVYCGRDGWLFYRPAVDHLTASGFLEERQLKRRVDVGNEWQEPPQPDPMVAIIEFRDQLAGSGIELLLVPIPVKAAIHPEMLSPRFVNAAEPVFNPSFPRFLSELADHGVRFFDPTPLLWRNRFVSADAQFLKTDTHWTPQAMDLVAASIAKTVTDILGRPDPSDFELSEEDLEVSRVGDLAEMLEIESDFPKQSVQISAVHEVNGTLARTGESAEILFLGDSFANIYSQKALGWGGKAGLADRLSYHSQRPVATLIRNDDGAFATRLLLNGMLADGRDLLADTRIVVWEFTSRELSFGDWRLVPVEDPPTKSDDFYVPERGTTVVAEGTIAALAEAPDPQGAPYADYIVGLHLVDLRSEVDIDGDQALVFTWAMKDRQLTVGADYRIGQRIRLELKPWADVDQELGSISRGELYDTRLIFQPPCWGIETGP